MSTSLLLFTIALFAALVIAACALVADRAGHPMMAAGMAAVAWLFAGVGLALLAILAVVG
jgi:hypothetical protein